PREPEGSPAHLAYVIPLAGDEIPRGLMIDHRNAAGAVLDANRRFGVGPGDRLLALAPPGCARAIYDLFGALAAGATIVLPDDRARADATALAELLVRERVTVWHAPP